MILDFIIRCLRRQTWRGYVVAWLYYRLLLHRSVSRAREIVPVYQMGKVGSATVTNSLRKYSPSLSVHHIHILRPEKIQRFHKNVRESYSRPLVGPEQRVTLVERLVTEQYFREQLDRKRISRKWKVVTLVRDPVARNLSSFFEILDLQMDYGLKEKLEQRGKEVVIEELSGLFLTEYPGHNQPLVFFDTELRDNLDVDVFAMPFAREKGYQIYQGDKADVLLFRLEDFNQCASEAFHGFLGLTDFEIDSRNVGSEKDYAEVYRDVLKAIRLPDSYLSRMYTSRYATHFYSSDELRAFETKWRKPVGV